MSYLISGYQQKATLHLMFETSSLAGQAFLKINPEGIDPNTRKLIEAIFLRNVDTKLQECPTFYANLPEYVGPYSEDIAANPCLEFEPRKVLTYLDGEAAGDVTRQTFLKLLEEEKYEEAGKTVHVSTNNLCLPDIPLDNGPLQAREYLRKLEKVFDNCPNSYEKIFGYLQLANLRFESYLLTADTDEVLLKADILRLKDKAEALIKNLEQKTLPETDFMKKSKLNFLVLINIHLANIYNSGHLTNIDKAQEHFDKAFEIIGKIEDQDLKKDILIGMVRNYYNFLHDRKSSEEAVEFLSQFTKYCLSGFREKKGPAEMIDLKILRLNLDEPTKKQIFKSSCLYILIFSNFAFVENAEDEFRVINEIARDLDCNQKDELYKLSSELISKTKVLDRGIPGSQDFWERKSISIKLAFGKELSLSERFRLRLLEGR
ncbi:MAG: hypothetical protein JXA94_04500 [Parachlamydiales bacterium]|nr:hypothetical protein [Parachlamydiales bacterium]